MSDDNAELGIAQTQNKASEQRLSQTQGLRRQQAWRTAYFSERIIAYLFVACVLALTFVWIVDVPFFIRNLVTVVTFLLGVYVIVRTHQKKRLLDQNRNQQVRDHQNK